MNTPRTITGTVKAWISSSQFGPEDLKNEDAARIIGNVLSYTDSDMNRHGWVEIGVAEITVSLLASEDEMIRSKMKSLQAERRDVMARAEAEVVALDRKINNLLAITLDPS